MQKEIEQPVNHTELEASAKKAQDAREAVEQTEIRMFEQMEQFGRDTGCTFISNPGSRSIEFTTWQDALDFQDCFRTEKGLDVRIVEPPPNDPGAVFKKGYQVFPGLSRLGIKR